MAPRKTVPQPTAVIDSTVPSFLKKTYHMIDSCDPAVASWSEDGETFVVRDPSKFESEIIPQFFKHSKFTSFVRQLNFYSFRKIKFVETIRLDPKLEKETANFWRFRHENFQRGKPYLLTQIKRMTASQNRAAAEKAAKEQAQATAVTSNGSSTDTMEMKEEIDTLKQRLEEMNRNMSELTSMVQKVSLKDNASDESTVAVGNKRKKVELVLPEQVQSYHPGAALSERLPEVSLEVLLEEDQHMANLFPNDPISMDAADQALGLPMSMSSPQSNFRATSTTSNLTDADFVDQLMDAYGSDGEGEILLPQPEVVASAVPVPVKNDNRPDPELMDRLSEALAVLPKDMQEQIVNRLVANITSNSLFTGIKAAADVVPTPKKEDDDNDDDTPVVLAAQTPEEGAATEMPLAAATLASLLSYYSSLVKDKEEADRNANKPATVKPMQVIPCHA